jgi:hypothetical protein
LSYILGVEKTAVVTGFQAAPLGIAIDLVTATCGGIFMKYTSRKVYRFHVELRETDIWREIDVPDNYNFWELHVALQDAMGWLDYHLHEFRPRKKGPTQGEPIGIPDDDFGRKIIAGWEVPIKKYFTTLGNSIRYDYDFGDGWTHEITLTGMFLAVENKHYPTCHAGEMACPPEDCGGVPGYEHLLEVLKDAEHEEYVDMVEWLKSHVTKYWPFKPERFSAKRVKFDDPYRRWCAAFNQPHDEY